MLISTETKQKLNIKDAIDRVHVNPVYSPDHASGIPQLGCNVGL